PDDFAERDQPSRRRCVSIVLHAAWSTCDRASCRRRLLVLDDLQNDFAIGARSGGVQNGADGFGGAALFADDAPEILAGHLELEDGRGVTLRLFDLDGVRIVDEVPG